MPTVTVNNNALRPPCPALLSSPTTGVEQRRGSQGAWSVPRSVVVALAAQTGTVRVALSEDKDTDKNDGAVRVRSSQ